MGKGRELGHRDEDVQGQAEQRHAEVAHWERHPVSFCDRWQRLLRSNARGEAARSFKAAKHCAAVVTQQASVTQEKLCKLMSRCQVSNAERQRKVL